MAEVGQFDAASAGRRLDYLLDAWDARPHAEYGNAEFAADLTMQGQLISIGGVERMRLTGHGLDDPVMLAAIEAALHVPPVYFTDVAVATNLQQDLELLLTFAHYQDAYRRSGVRGMSMHGDGLAADDREGQLKWYRMMTDILQDVARRTGEHGYQTSAADGDTVVAPGPPVRRENRPRRRWFLR